MYKCVVTFYLKRVNESLRCLTPTTQNHTLALSFVQLPLLQVSVTRQILLNCCVWSKTSHMPYGQCLRTGYVFCHFSIPIGLGNIITCQKEIHFLKCCITCLSVSGKRDTVCCITCLSVSGKRDTICCITCLSVSGKRDTICYRHFLLTLIVQHIHLQC